MKSQAVREGGEFALQLEYLAVSAILTSTAIDINIKIKSHDL